MDDFKSVALSLVAEGKGILAADESFGTIEKRLKKIGVESTEETRRTYRELLVTTDEIERYISGIILFDETIRQKAQDKPFPDYLKERGIIPGIKVDEGKVDISECPGELVTKGLDGLEDRLNEYKNLGAKFTKWRTVVPISDITPTDKALEMNSETQASFAELSQKAGLVPIVEPEVLIDGAHSIEKSREVSYRTLNTVFKKLVDHKVDLSGMLLKASMVTPGKESQEKATPDKVARQTIDCFSEVVPADLPGVVFLSGGQTPEEATANLNAMNKIGGVPWELSFSFARALQGPAMNTWQGKEENIVAAQEAFLKRCKLNSLARLGKYEEKMENE